uniref:RING-type domain-containing protein n=1 Tax=Haemonchus contortus TaxID=6289 RepID=A0A7I4YDJ5_HAECO|nr:Zinc finger and BRCT domain containing protein [Haemonchus contortus]
MSAQSLYEYALKINNVMAKIQAELKCGICCSTFSNPVSATCGHVFCKDCLDVVFQRRRVVECPLCRQSINKRSCTPSEQHDSMVKGYLQLGRNFLRDSQEQTLSIPKDVAFMDSQVPVGPDLGYSQIRDFRPEPHFALPKARARRRQPLKIETATKFAKMEDIAEEAKCKENTPLQSMNAEFEDQQSTILARRCEKDIARYSQTKSVEVQCNIPDPACVCHSLRRSLKSYRELNLDHTSEGSDLDALFVLLPELKDLLMENVPTLCEVLKLPHITTTSTLQAQAIEPVEEAAVGCSSGVVTLDDFASDDDGEELNATQPPALLKSEIVTGPATVVDLNGNKDNSNAENERPNSSCTRSSSDVVLQSSPSNEAGDEDGDITIQFPFDSIPCETNGCPSADNNMDTLDQKALVVSVSRLNCLEDEKVVSDFIKMFPQVRYEEDVTCSSTHLVMMNSHQRLCQRRSLRYVFAVARKCELLDRSWLEESIKAQRLLSTAQHVLACETPDEEPGWIRARQTTQPLFGQMGFFLPKTFTHSKLLPYEKLKELITLCGGTCCDKPWELVSFKIAYTIFMSNSTEWDAARRYEASMNGVPVLVADWILDSIAEFRVKPIEPYKIQRKH